MSQDTSKTLNTPDTDQDSNQEAFDLNLHMHRLLLKEPFFAGLSRRINKVESTRVPTAGVWVNPDNAQFELIYNPQFFQKLTDTQRLGVLKHEFYHLIFEHITGRRPIHPANPKRLTQDEAVTLKLWNYATDLAINSHLPDELPDGCCLPGKKPFENLPLGKTAEYYFEKVKEIYKQQQEQQKQNGSSSDQNQSGQDGQGGDGGSGGEAGDSVDDSLGGGQFDDHNEWNNTSEDQSGSANGGDQSEGEAGDSQTVEEIAKERLKDLLKKAANEAGQAGGWGSVPSQIQSDILELLKSKIDWRKVLRYFVKTSQRAHKSSTVRRINKRYRYIHPGKRVNRTAKICVLIDQSGSVCDAMLAAFFGELAGLAEFCEFTVVPFDTEVDKPNIFVWKKGQRVKPKRTRCGGTCFNAGTDYVNKENFDACIFLTDLCAPKPKACKVQRLWVTTETYAQRPYFETKERVIAIPDKDLKGGW